MLAKGGFSDKKCTKIVLFFDQSSAPDPADGRAATLPRPTSQLAGKYLLPIPLPQRIRSGPFLNMITWPP